MNRIEILEAELKQMKIEREEFIRGLEDMAHEIGRLEQTCEAYEKAIGIIDGLL